MATQVSTGIEVGERPTRVRYWVILFTVTLAIITYIDRVTMSRAAPFVMANLGLSRVQMSYVFSAFALAYQFAVNFLIWPHQPLCDRGGWSAAMNG
jgi:hypothetical protein